jgi:PAS domain-containing protein
MPPEDELSRRRRTEEKLKAAVSQLTATLDSTTDGIAVIGFDNRLLRYNQRFADLWRISRDDLDAGDTTGLLGMAIAQLAEPESFFAPVQVLKDDPLGETFDRLVFKDGRVYERFSRPLLSEGRATGRVWSFRDITVRVRAEALQIALYKISQAAHFSRDLDSLFEAIHAIIAELLPAKNFYVALYDAATDLITFP